jgi:hypothetical protein
MAGVIAVVYIEVLPSTVLITHYEAICPRLGCVTGVEGRAGGIPVCQTLQDVVVHRT